MFSKKNALVLFAGLILVVSCLLSCDKKSTSSTGEDVSYESSSKIKYGEYNDVDKLALNCLAGIKKFEMFSEKSDDGYIYFDDIPNMVQWGALMSVPMSFAVDADDCDVTLKTEFDMILSDGAGGTYQSIFELDNEIAAGYMLDIATAAAEEGLTAAGVMSMLDTIVVVDKKSRSQKPMFVRPVALKLNYMYIEEYDYDSIPAEALN